MALTGARTNGNVPSVLSRSRLVDGLRVRQAEIVEAIVVYVGALSVTMGDEDTDYVLGLHLAVSELVDYGLTGIEQGDGWDAPIPSAAVMQARRAASNGVDLGIVLRRYAGGARLLSEFVAAEANGASPDVLCSVLRVLGALVDRLMVHIEGEYARELQRLRDSPRQRLVQRIRGLLADTTVDLVGIDYDFEAWHVGVIATNRGSELILRTLASDLNRRLLLIPHGEDSAWAWFGAQNRFESKDIERCLSQSELITVTLSVGEPAHGIDGWRLTHRQAQAALLVSMHRPRRLTFYAEVMLLAAALKDDLLSRSLEAIHLKPLDNSRSEGAALRTTLRAYLGAESNTTSAAAALGVARQTVENRLRAIEKRLGRPIRACLSELDLALKLVDLRQTQSST